jgi:AcrR family transcriptional regulator
MITAKPRGRPRDQGARAKVLTAARELMSEGGIAAVTMEELAARTGVGKPTIYRSWPNAKAVAMAALMAMPATKAPPQRARSAIAELRQHVRGVVTAFTSRIGRNAATLIASADAGTEMAKAFRHHVILNSREQLRAIVQRAVADGAISRAIDVEIALDLILAPVFFRLLLGHLPLDEEFADAVIDQALAGLAAA